MTDDVTLLKFEPRTVMKAMVVRAPGGTEVLRDGDDCRAGGGAEGRRHQGRCLRRVLPRHRHAQRHVEARRADAVHPRATRCPASSSRSAATCAASSRRPGRDGAALSHLRRVPHCRIGPRDARARPQVHRRRRHDRRLRRICRRSRTTTSRWCPTASRCRTPRSSPARSAPILNAMREVGSCRRARARWSPGAGGGLGMHARAARAARRRLRDRAVPPRPRRPGRSARSARMR